LPEIPSEDVLEKMVKEEIEEIECQPTGFREIRRVAMQKVWDIADKLEERGYELTNEMFRKLVREVWKEIKKLPACTVK